MIGIGNITNAQKSLGIFDTALEGIVDARAMTGASLSRIDHEISELDSSYVQKEKSLGRIEDLDVARAATQLAKAEIRLRSCTRYSLTPMNYLVNVTMWKNFNRKADKI